MPRAEKHVMTTNSNGARLSHGAQRWPMVEAQGLDETIWTSPKELGYDDG